MVGADPDVNRWGRIKAEESALRQSLRNDGKNKRVPSKGSKLSGGYLEGGGGDSDDDAAVSIAAIKAKYGKGGAATAKPASGGLKAGPGKPVYSSGSDSDSDNSRKGGKSSGSDSDSGKSKGSRKSRSRSASSKSRSPSSSRSRWLAIFFSFDHLL